MFDAWFRQYPADIFNLGVQAAWGLVKDYLPSVPAMTMAAAGLQNEAPPAPRMNA